MECIGRIEENTSLGRDKFLASHTLQDAVLRNLQTLSESAQRLSDPLKAAHQEVEWRRIAGFRNVLVHDYLSTDLERIWEIISRDVPSLKRTISAMLQKAPGTARLPTDTAEH